jgi:hypothetical protein
MNYLGLDYHKKYSFATIITEDSEIKEKEKFLNCDLPPKNGSTLKVRVEPLPYSEGRQQCGENDSPQ